MEKVSLAPILLWAFCKTPWGEFQGDWLIDWLIDYVMPLRWLSSTITEVAKLAAATMDPITVCSERGAPPGQIGWPFSCTFQMAQVLISSWATLDCADIVLIMFDFQSDSIFRVCGWGHPGRVAFASLFVSSHVLSGFFWYIVSFLPLSCKSYCHLPRGLGQKHTATLTT